MVRHPPHKRWKGHDQMCNPHKIKGAGVEKFPFRVLRQFGQRRRIRKLRRDDV